MTDTQIRTYITRNGKTTAATMHETVDLVAWVKQEIAGIAYDAAFDQWVAEGFRGGQARMNRLMDAERARLSFEIDGPHVTILRTNEVNVL